jgi:hypothetical protein
LAVYLPGHDPIRKPVSTFHAQSMIGSDGIKTEALASFFDAFSAADKSMQSA